MDEPKFVPHFQHPATHYIEPVQDYPYVAAVIIGLSMVFAFGHFQNVMFGVLITFQIAVVMQFVLLFFEQNHGSSWYVRFVHTTHN